MYRMLLRTCLQITMVFGSSFGCWQTSNIQCLPRLCRTRDLVSAEGPQMPIPQSGERFLRENADPEQVVAPLDKERRKSVKKETKDGKLGFEPFIDDGKSVGSYKSSRTAKSSLYPNIPFKDCKWDFFLCCTPPGRKAVSALYDALPERFEGCKLWLDEQHDSTDKTLVDGICYSRSTSDAKWQHQMRVAIGARRNFILLGETDEMQGKPSIDELISKCPSDLKSIFESNLIIPYFSDPDFRSVTFEKMCRAQWVDISEEAEESHHIQKHRKDLFYKLFPYDEDTDPAVFPKNFVSFAAAVGLPLPGVSPRATRWSLFVRAYLVVCMLLCSMRFFTPQGPGFLDYLSIAQLVALHPVLLLMISVTTWVLGSKEVKDLLEHQIECTKEGNRLRLKLERLTLVLGALTAVFSLWGWIGYLPGFWTNYYLESTQDAYPFFGVLGILHGLAWFLSLPLVFGIFFATLLVAFALQELGYMGLVSAFDELHPEIASAGLEEITATSAGMNVKDGDLYRFQVRYLQCWNLYRRMQWKASIPFVLFWVAEVCLLAWSIWSIVQGFEPIADERAARFQAHWHLPVRLTWLVGASPWFGVAGYMIGLLPWGSSFYANKIMTASNRLFFTNTNLRSCFLSFMHDFELEFRVLFLQAVPWTLLLSLPILLVNSLGYVADVVRLFRAL
ncbi:unnamed protein product [Durusdinium trenchii]|uniref:Uncharacterized protein n=1 Tax=Durusdinium trenchii TaxID=1381693 RepID=A0ABP0RW39_9DINO